MTRAIVAAAAVALAALPAAAQRIATQVAQAPDGVVRMSFAARPGVCGNGRNITTSRENDEWESDCDSGPVRVALSVRSHAVISIRAYVGGRWRPATSGVTDLGQVPAAEAAEYLLQLAGRADGRPGRDAIFPATLADSAVVWPRLLAIARNDAAPASSRKQAVFWLGQEASEVATQGLDSMVFEDSLDRSLREQAVFALSQRPHDEGVPALIRVARTHRDPAIRRKALFWLAQSGDPRALALFEEVLKK